MTDFEMNPKEEALFDRLVDSGQFNAYEARQRIVAERRQSVGHQAAAAVVASPETKRPSGHHSRRGGRAYPEPSDSELDPYWNVGTSAARKIVDPETDAIIQKVKTDAQEAAIRSMAKQTGMSLQEAAARYKAQKERSRR